MNDDNADFPYPAVLPREMRATTSRYRAWPETNFARARKSAFLYSELLIFRYAKSIK